MANKAEIELGVKGGSAAARDIDGVKDSVKGLKNEVQNMKLDRILGDSQKQFDIAGKAVDLLKDTLQGAYRAATNFSRAANDIKPINFGAAADRAKAFDDTITRMSIRSGKQVDSLRSTFTNLGKEIGVMPERVANATRSFNRLTNSNDGELAIKALGDEANDTDRSLEEMVDIGASFTNKLGVPAQRVAGELLKIKNIAQDLQTVGGRVALEGTLNRLSPLLSRFAGGARHHAAILAMLGKGKSPEVAEEEAAALYSGLGGADPILVTKALREVTKNRNYKPMQRDFFTGRMQYKDEVLPLLQQRVKQAPNPAGAAIRLFGGNVGAAETLLNANFGKAEEAEFGESGQRAKALGLPAERQVFRLDKLTEQDRQEIDSKEAVAGGQKSVYSRTAAGQRARVDVEKGNVELEVGGYIQKLRDQRDASYEGRRGEQALVDTAMQYLPGSIANGLSILDTGISASRQELGGDAYNKPDRVQGLEVELGSRSLQKLSDSIRNQPTVATPGPAAQAVEHNKAAGRAAANY